MSCLLHTAATFLYSDVFLVAHELYHYDIAPYLSLRIHARGFSDFLTFSASVIDNDCIDVKSLICL